MGKPAKKPIDKLTNKELSHRTWFQQGFCPEGAKLLARPWITTEHQREENDE
jgi:hypothetical protein|tara:strand:+ start:254 stop:409 length:156 start_codon:yes stop_codon:yes gene_type:complete